MAPYFEQYKSALRRGMERSIGNKNTTIGDIQTKIDEFRRKIDILQEQLATGNKEIAQLTQSFKTFDGLPEVDIFVEGPENGPIALSDFAKQATQERLESTTKDLRESAEEKLFSLFQIGQALNDSGIDTTIKISLNPNNDPQIGRDDSSLEEFEVQINGKIVVFSPREKSVYAFLEQHEGKRINYRDIHEALPEFSMEQISGIISALRRKIEDNPRDPKHIKGKRHYKVGGIIFRKFPTG